MPPKSGGYQEGPGFPRGAQNGYQQGFLFRREAPARNQDERNHVGHDEFGMRLDNRVMRGRATSMMPQNGVLYHGTSSALGDLSQIEPGHQARREDMRLSMNAAKEGRGQHAYATTDINEAAEYARSAQKTFGGEPRILAVQPTGPVHLDPEYPTAIVNHATTDDRFHMDDEDADVHAVRSRKPFRVLNSIQFPEPDEEDW